MRDTLHRIGNILDGRPTRWRGQSLAEMALTAPILILMVLSLVEVGLVANNYLILMDVVRNAARDGVNFSPDPIHWNDINSRNQHMLACNTAKFGQYQLLGNDVTDQDNRLIPRAAGLPGYSTKDSAGNDLPQPSSYAYFQEIACQVTRGMAPLVFNDYAATPPNDHAPANPDAKDDIAVSAVSYAKIDYTKIVRDPSGGSDPRFTGSLNLTPGAGYAAGPGAHNDTWVTVTGRWPLANRYCVSTSGAGDERDPFDWKRTEFVSEWHDGSTTEDINEDPGPYYKLNSGSGKMEPTNADRTSGLLGGADQSQGVRGFIFTGRAKNSDDSCYGSRFTVQDIESKLNLDATWNPNTANGGVVIVELFWQHHPLVLGRLFEGFSGNRADDPVLYVWAWYPVPGIEPTLTPTLTTP